MQVGAYTQGLGLAETPNIDRIANEGAKMMTYYAEQSCTAGRNAFFTGMTPRALPRRAVCGTRNRIGGDIRQPSGHSHRE